MGKSNSKDILCKGIRKNNEELISNLLTQNPNLFKEFVNKNNDHTALCMAVYYGNLKAVQILVEGGADVNQCEDRRQNSPVMIAAKRNKLDIMIYLIQKGANVNHKNNYNLNVLDYAIIHANYSISFYLKNNWNTLEEKSEDEYIDLIKEMRVPLFNIILFFKNLKNKTDPAKTPCFVLTKEESTSNIFF